MKTVDQVADKMYEMIAASKGVKKFTARDLQSAMAELLGDDVDKKTCKNAVKQLINSGRCTYATYGGVTSVEIPPE
jgi:hypothetical protein